MSSNINSIRQKSVKANINAIKEEAAESEAPINVEVLTLRMKSQEKDLDFLNAQIKELVKEKDHWRALADQAKKESFTLYETSRKDRESAERIQDSLKQELGVINEKYTGEIETIKRDFERDIMVRDKTIMEQTSQLRSLQDELSSLKHVQALKNQLQDSLKHQNDLMVTQEKTYNETMSKLQHKLWQEQIKLEQMSDRKITEAMQFAQKESMEQIQELTRQVFAENIRLTESLGMHVDENRKLRLNVAELMRERAQLINEGKIHSDLLKEKLVQAKLQKISSEKSVGKIACLEKTLTEALEAFEKERKVYKQDAKKEIEEMKKIISELEVSMEQKCAEMKQIKKLSNHVIAQRTNMENFFMEALEEVRINLKKEKSKFKTVATSGAKKANPAESGVDISQLSWQDKEKILRLLFAKMNGIKPT